MTTPTPTHMLITLTHPQDDGGFVKWAFKAPAKVAAQVAFDRATERKPIGALIAYTETQEGVSLISRTSFNKDGARHGLCETWYENGQREYRTAYNNGHMHGLSESWYKNGQKRFETPFDNDRINGLQKGWYENGQQSDHFVFANNGKHGLSIKWNEAGEVTAHGLLEHSHKIGVWYEKGKNPAYAWYEFNRYQHNHAPVVAHSEAELHEKVTKYYGDKLKQNDISGLEISPL